MVLKVSHEDLAEDGITDGAGDDTAHAAIKKLADAADCVVVSRAEKPALAAMGGRLVEVTSPCLQEVDHRGAGDSMTAGIAAGIARGSSVEEALRMGAAAGTLNVTRRGLATGDRDAIETLARRIEVDEVLS